MARTTDAAAQSSSSAGSSSTAAMSAMNRETPSPSTTGAPSRSGSHPSARSDALWSDVRSYVRSDAAPTPDAEELRRLRRERKTLTAERVQHVNRIKGLLFEQGIGDYEPLHRDRRTRLDALTKYAGPSPKMA